MSDTLPLSIQNNRRLDKWLRFQPDRTVRLAVGKVEIGQGVLTALAQIAAEELDVGARTASTSCPAIPRTRRTRARPVAASRSRYPAVRCGWSPRSCARGCWTGWRNG